MRSHSTMPGLTDNRGRRSPQFHERVDIYANMYFYRLLEVLQEDFPATLRCSAPIAFTISSPGT